jgi:hypothetical protein
MDFVSSQSQMSFSSVIAAQLGQTALEQFLVPSELEPLMLRLILPFAWNVLSRTKILDAIVQHWQGIMRPFELRLGKLELRLLSACYYQANITSNFGRR